MTPMRAQAISIVEQFPEERISELLQMLLRLQLTYECYEENAKVSNAMRAVQNLQKYRKKGAKLHDYKKELADILEERYAILG